MKTILIKQLLCAGFTCFFSCILLAQDKNELACSGDNYTLRMYEPIPADMKTLTIISASPKSDQSNLETILEVYPNPTEELLFIKNTVNNSNVQSFTINDMNGKQLIIKANSKNISTINVSRLPAGIYILNLYLTDGSKTIKKIIKK